MGFFKDLVKSIPGSGVIGGIISGVGNAYAGSVINKGYKDQQAAYDQWIGDRRNQMNKIIYGDSTQNASDVAAVNQAKQIYDEQTQQTEQKNAVVNGTDESVALSKAAAAGNVANMLTQNAINNQNRQDMAMKSLNAAEDAYSNYIATSKLQQAQAKGNTISQTASSLGEATNTLLNPNPIK